MRGQVPPASSMPDWAATLMARRQACWTRCHRCQSWMRSRRRAAAGTCLVGDISNTFAPYAPLVASELSAALFHELIGFSTPDPDAVVALAEERLRALPAIAVAAPDAGAARAVFGLAGAVASRSRAARTDGLSACISASRREEVRVPSRRRRVPWRELLEKLGAWIAGVGCRRRAIRSSYLGSSGPGRCEPARRPRRAVH